MSYTPDTSPIFMFTNSSNFNIAKETTSYLPSNLNSVYENDTTYDSSINSITGSDCFCNLDFYGSVSDDDDTGMRNSLVRTNTDPNFTMSGRNTSPYKGWGSRLDDMVTNNGSTIRIEFYRSAYVSNTTLSVQQYNAFVSGVNLS